MKQLLIKFCLATANWLNGSPTRYGFINNINAFDRQFLEETLRDEPDMTVRQLLDMEKDFIPATLEHVKELNRELERREVLRRFDQS